MLPPNTSVMQRLLELPVDTGRVAFISTQHELETIIKLVQPLPALVAVTPEADYACEKRGVSYFTIEDLYSDEDVRLVARENPSRLEKICQLIDGGFAEFSGRCPACFSARQYRYSLKTLIDSLLFRHFTIRESLLRLKPAEVIFFEYPRVAPRDDLCFKTEPLLHRVMPLILSSFGIQGKSIYIDKHDDGPATTASQKPVPVIQDYHATTVIVAAMWENLHVLSLLKNKGVQLLNLYSLVDAEVPGVDTSPLLDRALKPLFVYLVKNPHFRSMFTYDGVDLTEAINDRLNHFLVNVIKKHIDVFDKLSFYLNKFTNVVVVGNSLVQLDSIACFAAARHAGIPTVVYQHGILNFNLDYKYTDTAFIDYLFCFGEDEVSFAEEYLVEHDESNIRTSATPVPLGCTDYDVLVSNFRNMPSKKNMKTTVLYVMGILRGDSRCFRGEPEADIAYWRLARDVISLCCQFDHVDLVVKVFPPASETIPNPIPRWIGESGFSNCHVISDIPFTELLQSADLVIADTLSSPAIETCTKGTELIVKIPGAYQPYEILYDYVTKLRKRAIVSTTNQQLLADIARVLSRQNGIPSLVDDSFLTGLGTYRNDGMSADRAANSLIALAKGGKLNKNGVIECAKHV